MMGVAASLIRGSSTETSVKEDNSNTDPLKTMKKHKDSLQKESMGTETTMETHRSTSIVDVKPEQVEKIKDSTKIYCFSKVVVQLL